MKTNESCGSFEEKNVYITQKYTLFQGIHRFKAYNNTNLVKEPLVIMKLIEIIYSLYCQQLFVQIQH